MKVVRLLFVFVVIQIIAVVGFAYSGWYDVAASSPHTGPMRWLLSTTARASIEQRAQAIDVPELESEALRLAGINDFEAMCADCHGAPGREPKPVGQGLNPPAPDLASVAARRSASELFWVTKHGIRMTGMPAWGVTHADEDLWAVVALLTILPELDAAGYESMLERAEGAGHHGAGAHDHAGADESAPDPAQETEDDGHTHEH